MAKQQPAIEQTSTILFGTTNQMVAKCCVMEGEVWRNHSSVESSLFLAKLVTN